MLTAVQEAGATRGKKQYIDLTTQKSGSIFTTRTLRDLSDKYLELQERYDKIQSNLVKEVVSIAGEHIAGQYSVRFEWCRSSASQRRIVRSLSFSIT